MSQRDVDALHKLIIDNSNYCTPDKLLILKQQYANEINSTRQLERICSIKDMLATLKKRDAINVICLQNISELLHINSKNHINNQLPNPPTVLPMVPETAKEKVYDLISSNIGHKWNELARGLGIAEGYIDQLEEHKTIKKRTLEILYYYEKRCDKRKWKSGLLDALIQARRNDLRKQVQEIFDIH